MTGSWGVYAPGRPWRRSPRRAWLILSRAGHEVVQFDGPVLELLTENRTRFDKRLAGLGPDVLADSFDEARFLARLRADDHTRGIGDALLDQRHVAGIGNIWKSEGCWEAAIDPWRRMGEVTDAEALAIIAGMRPRMMYSALHGRMRDEPRVFRHNGRPCPRCGARILARGQGDDNRTTFWCPGCQH
jgi:endonuclease-8